jgi:hypothetical protein
MPLRCTLSVCQPVSLRWPQRHKQHEHGDADDADFHGVISQATINTATNMAASSSRQMV